MHGFVIRLLVGRCALVAVLSILPAALAGAAHPMDGLNLSNPIHGEPVKMDDVKGKVILLEYWGINCGPCLASFPHLIEKQSKYEKTGRFMVIASHVQSNSQAAAEFCQQKNANFTVYHQLRVPAAPCGRGIPHAAIIDHTGAVVAQGHPMQLMQQLDQYIAKAPGQFSELVGDLTPQHHVRVAKKLEPGKSIASAYGSLRQAAPCRTTLPAIRRLPPRPRPAPAAT